MHYVNTGAVETSQNFFTRCPSWVSSSSPLHTTTAVCTATAGTAEACQVWFTPDVSSSAPSEVNAAVRIVPFIFRAPTLCRERRAPAARCPRCPGRPAGDCCCSSKLRNFPCHRRSGPKRAPRLRWPHHTYRNGGGALMPQSAEAGVQCRNQDERLLAGQRQGFLLGRHTYTLQRRKLHHSKQCSKATGLRPAAAHLQAPQPSCHDLQATCWACRRFFHESRTLRRPLRVHARRTQLQKTL